MCGPGFQKETTHSFINTHVYAHTHQSPRAKHKTLCSGPNEITMHSDQSALIREGSADLPAGENSTVPHFLLQGGLVYTICVCGREREHFHL